MSHLQIIRDLFTELFGWKGEVLGIVDAAMASYLATFLPGDIQKPWLALIGGPATGKSELLRLIGAYCRSVEKDHLTAAAFASQYQDPNNPDADLSLLQELGPSRPPIGRKVLICHEMSSHTAKIEQSMKLFADLRVAFDNTYNVHGGTTGSRTYESDFGFLCASTEVLDSYLRMNATIGERLVMFRTGKDIRDYDIHRGVALRTAVLDPCWEKAHKAKIREAIGKCLDECIEKAKVHQVVVSKKLEERLGLLGAVASRIQTSPLRTSYVTTPVGSSRIIKQIRSWGIAHALLDGRTEWSMTEFDMIRQITLDSLPPDNLRLFRELWRGSPQASIIPISRTDLARRARVDAEVAQRQLRQWSLVDFVELSGDDDFALKPAPAADTAMSVFLEDTKCLSTK